MPSSVLNIHNLAWGNMIRFLQSTPIDYVWHKGDGKVPSLNFNAVDDKYLIPAFESYLNQLQTGERFVGAIHFRGTHAPYFSSPDHLLWEPNRESNRYDNAVAYLDHNTHALLNLLKRRHLLKNTLIISTADHAEAFGEHGYSGHLHSFFEEESHIPMWIYVPPAVRNHEVLMTALRSNRKRAVSNADIIPTIIELLGLYDGDAVTDYLSRFTGHLNRYQYSRHQPAVL